jgi:two-component system, sensor histidine kinase RpfC
MAQPSPKMTLLRTLRLRLVERSDSEHEQAFLRIVIVGMFLAYMAGFHGWPGNWSVHDFRVVAILAAFLVIASAIFAAICASPQPNVSRRLIGMLADCGGCTWYMWVAGDYGFFVIGVYLFITFGNGFRYGRRYLFGCQALCLAGLVAVLLLVPYWQQRRIAGIGLLIALVVLPLYVSTLLKRIQEARARAEEANVAKTTFLANMSHEMRTPLNGVVGVVDLLKMTALSPHQNELVGLLRHSISVLRSLVDDVLDISKIEAGHLLIEVAPFDLYGCINGLVQLLKPHAEAKGLALQAVVDPALEYRLKGDSHHLRQVLLNLLSNAIKFTETGEVKLVVSLKRETDEGITARFEVTDTGIGISPDALPRIFERFVQADQSTTRKYGGTGLGTTIAKQLVELMGGNIGAQSTLGVGSTFWLELPLLRDTLSAGINADRIPEEHLHEQSSHGLVLVVGGARSAQVVSALLDIAQPHEVVGSIVQLGPRIQELKNAEIAIKGIVAACAIEQACAAFSTATQRLDSGKVALIYIADNELSLVDKARVNSIPGAFALDTPSPKLISNALHAVTAGADSLAPGIADLAAVLKRDRAPLKILVAEDNATNQRVVRQLLESAGYEIVLASDGEEALDLYESEQPDIAILDFNMPQRTGIEVIRAIRLMELPGTRMPTAILSASVTPEAREQASKAGADEFVGKPFDAADLIQRIDRLGGKTRRVRNGAFNMAPKTGHANLKTVPGGTTYKGPQSPPSKHARNSAGERLAPLQESDLVDRGRLGQLEDIARDSSFLAELIQGFASDVEAILTKLRSAIDTRSTTAIPDLMHSLKGAAVGVGANQLAALAVKIDNCAASGSSEQLESSVNELRTCFDATSAYLNQYLRVRHHAST